MYGKIVASHELSEKQKIDMLQLMQEFYDDVTEKAFKKDLEEKDYCILLLDEGGDIKGFSTQKLMTLDLGGQKVHGVFSGDTIIHKEHWGSLELYKVFSREFVKYANGMDNFYWFLISKGYKTYKMLPLFFKEFYPNCRTETPAFEQSVMDCFGRTKYPGEYDEKSGVVKYRGIKDKLKAGVADITEKLLEDRDIAYFIKANPGFVQGEDIVCLASLKEENIRKTAKRLFLGG